MSEWMLEETIRLSRELTAAQFRIAEQRDEITALQCELEQAQTAIAEMRGERACTCESLLSRESDNISLRAALGRAMGAIRRRVGTCSDCECQDCKAIRTVLSDPDGQKAGQEWTAMAEVCAAAERWQQAKLRYESGEEAAWEDARRELQALDGALCRLKEERQQ